MCIRDSRWTALVRPGRRLRAGATVRFGVAGAATIRRVREDGVREVELSYEGSLDDFLERAGEVPLPPYVGHASARARDGYQTVFARVPGSVAAPTASLHFTDAVFERLRERGVAMHKLTLDVGLGTFKPIGADRIDDHVMHAEHYAIPTDTAEAISAARAEGRRVIAAGTTVVRALEGAANLQGEVPAGTGEVNLYITPGYEFRVVDALLTNFHLPRSSLLVLVGAFAGRARMARAYAEAIRERYRFLSFGDAMVTEREASARTAQGMS